MANTRFQMESCPPYPFLVENNVDCFNRKAVSNTVNGTFTKNNASLSLRVYLKKKRTSRKNAVGPFLSSAQI